MATVNLQRTSWAFGELDQRMLGRTDLPTYRQGCSKLENWLPTKSGAISKRGGTQMLSCTVPDGFDWIMPIRGGARPLIGLYNATTQKLRVIKSDGSWVGDEAGPAEVTLFDEVSITINTDTSDPYAWTPSAAGEAASIGPFINAALPGFLADTMGATPKPASFELELSIAAAPAVTQKISMVGGTVKTVRAATNTVTFTPVRNAASKLHGLFGATDSYFGITDAGVGEAAIQASTLGRYIEKVILKVSDSDNSAGTIELYIDDEADLGSGSGHDIDRWEANSGKITIRHASSPGENPLWAVEPNRHYEEVALRLCRASGDVKAYLITEDSIIEDTKGIGDIPNGRKAQHATFFEQRCVYGGGIDHKAEIIGSRTPDVAGANQYNKWEMYETLTTEATGTTTQVFTVSDAELYHFKTTDSDHDELETERALRLTMTPGTANREIHADFVAGTGNTPSSAGSNHPIPNYLKFVDLYKVGLTNGYGSDTIAEMRTSNVSNSAYGADEVNGMLNEAFEGVTSATAGGRIIVAYGTQRTATFTFRGADTSSPYLWTFDAGSTNIATAQEKADAEALIDAVFEDHTAFQGKASLSNDTDGTSFTVVLEKGTGTATTSNPVVASNAFRWVIDAGATHAEIRWLSTFSGVLVMGTSAGINIGKFLNPDDSPEFRWHSSQSVAPLPPLTTPIGIIAIASDRTGIYEVIRKRDLTAYSEDRFRNDRIRQIAWQQLPIQRLWVVTDSGKIHVLTIQDETGVQGWTSITHNHTGTCLGVTTTACDDDNDAVWLLIKHGNNRYVEMYHEGNAGLHSKRMFMDSGVKRTVGKQVINMTESDVRFDIDDNGGTLAFGIARTMDNMLSDIFLQNIDGTYVDATRYLCHVYFRGDTNVCTFDFAGNTTEECGDANSDLGDDFEANGKLTITHTDAITGEVDSLEVDFGDKASADSSDPYSFVHANNPGRVNTFVDKMNTKYLTTEGYRMSNKGSSNFSITLSLDKGGRPNQVACPVQCCNSTGALQITSAKADGDIDEAAKYEEITSPTKTACNTNFDFGQEVWIGFKVTADMSLPAISQSISGRVSGSWLGQPARIPWVGAGVERAHGLKIGPTYDKLVEYFADVTPLSLTVAIPSQNQTEPYVFAPSNTSELNAWVAAVKALHPVGTRVFGGNLFTVTLTAGAATHTQTCDELTIEANRVVLSFERSPATLLPTGFRASGGDTRYAASIYFSDSGYAQAYEVRVQVAPDLTTSSTTADARLNATWESSGTVTVTRTPNAPLVTGQERRPLPTHITYTEPTVVRKDTPSPATMTWLVAEATVG